MNKKIAVIGCPGAGKTTFAIKLGKALCLPVVHLDKTYHDSTRWSKDLGEKRIAWREHVVKLAAQSRWIIDGNYRSTFQERFKQADLIIFLDYPARISLYRAFKRLFKHHKVLRPDMPETWREHISWHFFLFILKYNITIRKEVYSYLEQESEEKVTVLRSPKQATEYLKSLA